MYGTPREITTAKEGELAVHIKKKQVPSRYVQRVIKSALDRSVPAVDWYEFSCRCNAWPVPWQAR